MHDYSKTWSHSTLSLARHEMSAFAIGNKAYFAGGNLGPGAQPPSHLNIYDANTNTWSAKILSVWILRNLPAVVAGNNAILVPGLREMYAFNALTDTWSTFPFWISEDIQLSLVQAILFMLSKAKIMLT